MNVLLLQGGAIVQNVLVQYQQYIQSAVIGCSLVNGITAPKSPEFIEFAKQVPSTPDEAKQYQLNFLQYLYTEDMINSPVHQPYLQRVGEIRNKYKRDPQGCKQQAYALSTHNCDDKLGVINVPVLIQHGTADKMLLYSNGEMLHKLIANSELSTYEGCGHVYWAHEWQKGDEARLPTELRDWFNKHE